MVGDSVEVQAESAKQGDTVLRGNGLGYERELSAGERNSILGDLWAPHRRWDADGACQTLREDSEYHAVCKEMSASVYPDELRDAAPGPDVDRASVERWFRNHTGFGDAAAKRLALVYSLIESGNASRGCLPRACAS